MAVEGGQGAIETVHCGEARQKLKYLDAKLG
jgi:hypothetical protein